mmetsp:Transcript_120134/g.351108  ORF Transcript_120134/g.351108 Transcript_120134/m.351108 type:complete len:227 (-) Transcript_120134:30-710(-)
MAVPLVDTPEAAAKPFVLSVRPRPLRQRNKVPHDTNRRMHPCRLDNFLNHCLEDRLDTLKRFAEGVGVSSVKPAVRKHHHWHEICVSSTLKPPHICTSDSCDIRQLLPPRQDAPFISELHEVLCVNKRAIIEQLFDCLAAVLHPPLGRPNRGKCSLCLLHQSLLRLLRTPCRCCLLVSGTEVCLSGARRHLQVLLGLRLPTDANLADPHCMRPHGFALGLQSCRPS